ncbi:MAG: hypothetical protein LBC20_09330 [Planctomycetaceae bacterium]|jgi:hypothetical protein|nr:hypothetical protein [Planctomycetaceae bacterium]
MKKNKKYYKKNSYLQNKLDYKKQSLMTPKEAYDYYVKEHPFLLICIFFIMVLTVLTIIVWDGTIPVKIGTLIFLK